MKKSYDFLISGENPRLKKPNKQLTIRLREDTINYFRSFAEESGIPYQSLTNLYLRDCATGNTKQRMNWASSRITTSVVLHY